MLAVAVGVAFGLIVASVMTFLDWRLNPGGIFHDAQGTDWGIVSETAVRWFTPIAAAMGGVAAVVLFLLSRRKQRPNDA
jgi:hypothetical protein